MEDGIFDAIFKPLINVGSAERWFVWYHVRLNLAYPAMLSALPTNIEMKGIFGAPKSVVLTRKHKHTSLKAPEVALSRTLITISVCNL
jgi:hypothetical protein